MRRISEKRLKAMTPEERDKVAKEAYDEFIELGKKLTEILEKDNPKQEGMNEDK